MGEYTFVFAHAAFVRDPEWWWEPLTSLLERRGCRCAVPGLPSCGDEPPLGDLHDDAAAVRAAVGSADGPVVLCGHSYGGLVMTEAGAGDDRVAHLVYIAVPLLSDGPSLAEWLADHGGPPQELDFREDGTIGEDVPGYAERVLSSLPDRALVDGALARLTRQSAIPFTQSPQGIAWREHPTTYMVCTEDGDLPPDQQREQAQRAGNTIELPTNHLPQFERPALLADAILSAVGVTAAR